MARSVRAEAPVPELLPWHRRYRLLLQVGGLVAFAGVLVGIVLVVVTGGDKGFSSEANRQLREDLALVMGSITLPASDLPPGWTLGSGGLGIQGNLRRANLGPATAAADSPVGNAAGWFLAGDPRMLSSGIIVADGAELASAAFQRMRDASDAEAVAYVEPTATGILSVERLGLSQVSEPRFGFVASYERGEQETGEQPGATRPFRLSTTVVWTVFGNALIYVSLNDLLSSPPIPAPVDLEAWLDALVVSYRSAAAATIEAR